jgi:hypothetical protein
MVLFLPAAALLAGIAAAACTQFLASGSRFVRGAAIWLAAAGLAQAFYVGRDIYFLQTPWAASRTMYRFNPYIEATEVGAYLRTHCPKDARIAVIGSEPEIYFYARRRSATGYLSTYPLVENQPYAERMQNEFFAEIEKGVPDYVVFVDLAASWRHGLTTSQAARTTVLEWFQRYELENLTLVGLKELSDTKEKDWQWEFAGPKTAQPSLPWIAIYRRMSPPQHNPQDREQKPLVDRRGRTTIVW